MKQKIQAGATFDFATPDEVKGHIDQLVANLKQEEARGIALWRDDAEADVATGSVTIPKAGAATKIGANPGFAVLIQSARVAGLASNDVITVYRNVVVDKNLVGQLTFAAPTTGFGSKGLILKGGETVIFTGSSLTATTVTVNLEGIEVPETDLYKLVSP
jgi:hypothetical protein